MDAVIQSKARRLPHRPEKRVVPRANNRLIVGDGCAESEWLPWLQTLAVKSVRLEDVVPSGRRLVVVAPHPDDEILACGALIALQVQAAQEVLVVYVTDGEASHGRQGAAARRTLSQARQLESRQGLAVLGAGKEAALRLGVPDGDVNGHGTQLWSQLLQVLRPDDVVVTTWSHDGHPDHEACSRATQSACALVGCDVIEAPVWMWHWSLPNDERVPFGSLVGLPVPPQVAQAKHDALLCHESQLTMGPARSTPVLGHAICQRVLRPVEYYFVSRGLRERLQPRLL